MLVRILLFFFPFPSSLEDESSGPFAPRNIYGVTKLAAEGLCRLYAAEHGLASIVLRTGRFFPDAAELYAARGWVLPGRIGRVYDAGHAERRLSFGCRTGFAEVLAAMREGRALPFAHDPDYVSPQEASRVGTG